MYNVMDGDCYVKQSKSAYKAQCERELKLWKIDREETNSILGVLFDLIELLFESESLMPTPDELVDNLVCSGDIIDLDDEPYCDMSPDELRDRFDPMLISNGYALLSF